MADQVTNDERYYQKEQMMHNSQILFVKPGSISKTGKRKLSKAGIILIEHDDPLSVKFVMATPEIENGALLSCAMKAVASCKFATSNFGNELVKIITKKASLTSSPT